MKPTFSRWQLFTWALALVAGACGAADATAPHSPLAQEQVGKLGGREAIVFEGNHAFTTNQILNTLAIGLDFHLAAHRRASLREYTGLLERKITLGYQHAGFPDVSVKAAPDMNANQIRVQIKEGPRFRCGEIFLSGAAAMTNATVLQAIRDVLCGDSLILLRTNLVPVLWASNASAALDPGAREVLKLAVQRVLEDLNYYQPKVNLQVLCDAKRKVADLRVEIPDEGIKGAIEQIVLSGIRTNTRQAVLDYLDLRTGMAPQAHLLHSISNKLRGSGRFFHHDAVLLPQRKAGQFKLELDLEELAGAPPLDQELSPREAALKRFGEWLTGWQEQPEDFVASIGFDNSSLQMEAALSTAGFACVGRRASSNGPPVLTYALVASQSGDLGLYSVWKRKKFVCRLPRAEFVAYLAMSPGSRQSGTSRFALTMGAWLKMKRNSSQAFQFVLDVPPVVVVGQANLQEATYSLEDGVLTIGTTNSTRDMWAQLQTELETGRLRRITWANTNMVPFMTELRAEEGAFARLVREISSRTATHRNEHIPNHGLSSGLAFVVTELVNSPITDRLLELFAMDESRDAEQTRRLAPLRSISAVLGQLAAVLDEQKLADVFEPLNQLQAFQPESEESEAFPVPSDVLAAQPGANPMMAVFAAAALQYTDGLLVRDSWPWVLLREKIFAMAGGGEHTKAELQAFLRSTEMGPVGCLAAARLLGRTNPRQARAFAEKGLARLTPGEFHRDYRLLFESETLGSQVLANALGLLGGMNDEQIKAAATCLEPEHAAFLQQLAKCVQTGKDQPAGAAAWPAFQQHWDPVVRLYLELGLNAYLPQVQFLTNPVALYTRGRKVIAPGSVLQDFEEAAQCFRKAAEQGHGASQLRLGRLLTLGKGVAQDYAEAMRWYRSAFELKTPHAGCRIADLYRDGKGVSRNLDEAAKWYRPEAKAGCAAAQFNLGLILEAQLLWPEVLKWYRGAAAMGYVPAQMRLGDILSDGLTVAPDYVEACQWLMLAAQAQTNRLTGVQLRTLKAKLTPKQVEDAQRAAEAVTKRLNGKDLETPE